MKKCNDSALEAIARIALGGDVSDVNYLSSKVRKAMCAM